MSASFDPEAVVQRQLDVYNARDIEGLLATYADDAQLFEHPATLLANGAAELRARFSQRFKEPNLHANLLSRIASGTFVIDHERITRKNISRGAGHTRGRHDLRGARRKDCTLVGHWRSTLTAPASLWCGERLGPPH